MTQTPKTDPAQLRAVKQYEKKVKKLQIVLNIKDNPQEAALYKAIKADSTPFGTLVKQLLTEHYNSE